MNALSILTALVKGGMTPIAACAMGGNMIAESGMKSNIAQRGMTKLSDEEYTQAADAKTIDFVNDGVGYGLCQWTYITRKADLIDFAKRHKRSVGDESMQVKFCIEELKSDYTDLFVYLMETTSLYEATSKICKEYECPAVNNIEERAKFANELYMSYGELLERMRNEDLSAAAATAPLTGEPRAGESDAEPSSYIMGTVRQGEHTPEAIFMMARLKKVGYDVMWDGLTNCLRDFQQKKGLTVDGVCGEKTWRELMK